MPKRTSSHDAPGERGTGEERRAPGHGETYGAPAPSPAPSINDRLAVPETRIEYIDGKALYAAPARPPHATRHFDLNYVLGAYVTESYLGAVDMLTRVEAQSDFAPDASIFPAEPDPDTGERRLEELAFEITDKQALSVPTVKARKLIARGVRRVFCILVKQRRLLEWSRETDTWHTLPQNAVIEDPCLVRPLPVASLLDHATADEAVARALLDKRVPALDAALVAEKEAGRVEGRAEGRVEGRAEGRAEGRLEGQLQGRIEGQLEGLRRALRSLLEPRCGAIPEAAAGAIAACTDSATLDGWLHRVAFDAVEPLLRDISAYRPR